MTGIPISNMLPNIKLPSVCGENMPINRKNGTNSRPNNRYKTPRNLADWPMRIA